MGKEEELTTRMGKETREPSDVRYGVEMATVTAELASDAFICSTCLLVCR